MDEDSVLQERARIARELHDGVAQTLYAIGLIAARALELIEGQQEVNLEPLLDRVLELADGGQREVRALLNSAWVDEPNVGDLTGALIGLAAAYEASHGAKVRLALGSEPDISPASRQALVRITREALRNAAKHAKAAHIELALNVSSEQVELSIADDGRGFDLARPRPGHFGLRTMRERAEVVGGSLEVVSRVGEGTLIQVRVPRSGR